MSPADTWWGVLLDGLLGGLVGGAITGLAVWATLHHERRLSNAVGAQQAAATLMKTAQTLMLAIDRADANSVENLTISLQTDVVEFAARTNLHWPNTSSMVRRIGENVGAGAAKAFHYRKASDEDINDLQEHAFMLAGTAAQWLSDPARVERTLGTTAPQHGFKRFQSRWPWLRRLRRRAPEDSNHRPAEDVPEDIGTAP